jgi:hypothetical protein
MAKHIRGLQHSQGQGSYISFPDFGIRRDGERGSDAMWRARSLHGRLRL